MRTSKSRKRKKRNNLQVCATIDSRPAAAKQPCRPRGCSSRAMQAKRKNYAPELCNQRNYTTLPSYTTNLRTEGAHDSGPPPLLYKNEKIACASMDRQKRKQRVKQQKPALTRRRRIQPQTLGHCSRGKEENRATTEATYAHNRPSLLRQLAGT
jgi:hypothetical protein